MLTPFFNINTSYTVMTVARTFWVSPVCRLNQTFCACNDQSEQPQGLIYITVFRFNFIRFLASRITARALNTSKVQ